MFTDIVGYTASVNLMQREDIRRLVERHEQIVTGFLRSKGGDVVKNLGDSYMIIFSSATEVVKSWHGSFSTFGFTEQELLKMNEEETVPSTEISHHEANPDLEDLKP